MEPNKIKGHKEGATSATDTLTGASMAGIVLIAVRLVTGRYGIQLTEGEMLAVGGAVTGLFTGISSYIHGYLRGKK